MLTGVTFMKIKIEVEKADVLHRMHGVGNTGDGGGLTVVFIVTKFRPHNKYDHQNRVALRQLLQQSRRFSRL